MTTNCSAHSELHFGVCCMFVEALDQEFMVTSMRRMQIKPQVY